ncbi:DUF3987 domain-containing protein [Bacteroides sp.]
MRKCPMKVSFFVHLWEKVSTEITLEEFVNDVRSPRWKVLTEAYRNYLRRGFPKEAADVKSQMNGIVVAGTCRGGHAAAQVVSLSGWMMFDFDHTGARTKEVLARLCALSYVGVAFVSISGEGIKALVRVEVENAEEYRQAYAVIGDELCREVDFKHDEKCRDIGRVCSAVYDPDVYYRPDAEPFSWRDRVVPVVPVPSPVSSLSAGQASGFMQSFVDEFATRNSFVRGARHDFMLKLGRVARCKGFSPEELTALIGICAPRFSESDYPAVQGEKDVLAGYQYISEKLVAEDSGVKVQKVQGSRVVPRDRGNEEEDEGALSENNNILRTALPSFPKAVYDSLPDLLKRGVSVARGARERDMLLMGMMANLSACLPSVRFHYAGMEYSPHLYFAGVAPAGSGKGLVALAAYLSRPLHDQYVRESNRRRKEYETCKQAWEQEVQAAFRAKRTPDASLEPEEPHGICLMLPANASKSRTYIHLKDNGQLGAVVNATEINTMVSALGQDYGKQDDVYCAAAHHEDISSSFKVDGQPIFVHEPRLAMCLTGTPNQFVSLVHSQENGLYSRFGLLTASSEWVWLSAAPVEGRIEYRTFFCELGKEVQQMHNILLETPTEVTFTPSQWEEHSQRFAEWLDGVIMEGDDSPGAIVVRHGLYAIRLASILTALRKVESKWYVKEYICTDEDFHTAMSMVGVLLEHSLLLSSSLPEVSLKSRPLQRFYRIRLILERLSSIFSYSEFLSVAMEEGVSVSTSKRLLKRAVKYQFVENKDGKYYKKKAANGKMGPRVEPEPL